MTAGLSEFSRKVLLVVSQIPKGKVMTYKEVAKKAGNPNASRAVGSILKKNYNPKIPCHRVIKSNGSVGEYNKGGSAVKRKLLLKESAL